YLTGYLRDLFDGESALLHEVVKRFPLDVLHDNKTVAVQFFEPVHSAYVRMIQFRNGLSFLLQLPPGPCVVHQSLREKFERYITAEAGILCQVNLSHSPFAELT